mgnify:CR=1 FL=1
MIRLNDDYVVVSDNGNYTLKKDTHKIINNKHKYIPVGCYPTMDLAMIKFGKEIVEGSKIAEGYDLYETCRIYDRKAGFCRGLNETYCKREGVCAFYKGYERKPGADILYEIEEERWWEEEVERKLKRREYDRKRRAKGGM